MQQNSLAALGLPGLPTIIGRQPLRPDNIVECFWQQAVSNGARIVARYRAHVGAWPGEAIGFIKDNPGTPAIKQGEESREYKKGLQDQETAQRDHDAKVVAEAERAAKEETDTLKHSLDQAQKAREDNAKTSEVRLKSNAGASPFGDIKADQQIAAQQRQLIQEKLADNETFHADEAARLAKNVEDAKTKYAGDVEAYSAAIAAKRAEDQRYADAKQTLDAQLQLEQAQSTAQMRSKYESYISGTVSASVSGIDKMISGQMTLKNFGVSVYQSIAREAEQQVVKMATTWITQHVLMAIAAKLTGDSQVASAPAGAAATVAASKVAVSALAGQAGAAGIASMAAAPFPIDLGAPAFGAEMAANALALGSFAVGTNVVPNDMIAQIHAGERIIPKADNAALMEMTARGAGASGGGGGDTHNHFAPTINASGVNPKEILGVLENNFSDFKSMVARAVRGGKFR